MSLPFISCICCTYGRSARLREALACFLAQDYKGPHELVILNTFPQQQYTGTFPNVRIFNFPGRPASLATCRNLAISNAKGEVIVTFDDDDLYLPHYLSVVGEAYAESNADYVRLNPVFYADNFKVQKLFSTWINAVSFKKAAWEKIGGYPRNLSVGEDQALWSSLSTSFKGVTVELKPAEVPLIYCWNNGVQHISGKGWDKPGQTSAYERSRLELEHRVRRKDEPAGEIALSAQLAHDPVAMADEYLSRPKPEVKKGSVCLVELGRYGDIINILPIARHIAETYDVPHLMVSKEFASLLDGVSYVRPRIVDLKNDQLRQALRVAEAEFRHVINCQIWGTGWAQERLTPSFNRESWRMAGFNYRFNDFSPKWLPVFDKRDRAREAELLSKYKASGKPLLLVNVTHSMSSPFPAGTGLLDAIQKACSEEYEIIDCGNLKLERIYDVLGLMDVAEVLVSIDTALLHFAPGTTIPTIALVNDKPWQGSEIRGHHCILRLPYSEASEGRILNAIRDDALRLTQFVNPPALSAPPVRRIFHAVERHNEPNQKALSRKREAWSSWDTLYRDHGVIPCHYWEPYERTADKTIGDKRPLPYLKDVLKFAMNQADDEDIILWTNDDNILHPELPDMIRLHCSLHGCVCSQRCEFKQFKIPKLTEPPAIFAANSVLHMGRDLLAFTKSWLSERWNDIPDYILGASDFDLGMACLLRLQWGIQSTRANLEESMWPCELPRGYVSHRFHAPQWAEKANQWDAPSQKHNRLQFKTWAAKHLPTLNFLPGDVI